MDKLLVGRTLSDRYQVGEVLGRGGMSVVYRGLDQRLGREVAIKVIGNVGMPADREHLRARFRREAGAAAQIPHYPHVVQIYDYGTDTELDIDFIVMELLQGRDLKQAIAERDLSLPEAVRVLADAARGIAAGHRAGVVHRDIKPANILLTREHGGEQARVVDFGIAKPMAGTDELTVAGPAPYSPAYASPEQLNAATTISPASDVYQLGLVAYELLAGERPFAAGDRERIARGEPVPLAARGTWTAAPAPLRSVVERALQPDPGARWPDAQAFADALDTAAAQAFRAPRPAVAPVVPAPSHRASRRPRIGPIPLAIAGVLALLLVWALARRGKPDGATAEPETAAAVPVASPAQSDPRPAEPSARPGALAARTPARTGPDAVADVMRTVADANRAWVEGDLQEHISHYGRRVDYYNSKRLARSGVLRDRRRDLSRYPEREIIIDRQQVEFPEPGRARVLADKRWRFGGEERERRGQGLQEYILKQDDGRWYIVAERLLEEVRSERQVPSIESN